MPIVGNRIRERRLALGLSQQQLGGKEITRSFVSLIEQGKAQPSKETLELIAKRLGKPPEYFITEERDGDLEAVLLLEKATQRCMAEKRWQEAIEHAESALRMSERIRRPEVDLRLRACLAYSLLYSHKYQIALEIYEQVIEESRALNERDTLAEAYFRKGMCYQRLEDYANARRGYMEAVRLTAEKKSLAEIQGYALVNLGSCYAIMGQLEDAFDAYERATTVVLPSEHPLIYADACRGISVCMKWQSRLKEAFYYAQRAVNTLERVSEQAALDARVTAAGIQAELGEPELALHQLQTCLEMYRATSLLQRQAWVMEGIALCYLKMGLLEQVEQACEECLNLLDLRDDGLIRGIVYRRLAQVRYIRGDKERALEHLRVSINLFRRLKAHEELAESSRLMLEWR